MKTRVACQYAIIQFLPYPETGEFANVGVVLACPSLNFLSAKILPPRKIGRITSFFDRLDASVLKSVTANLREEFGRLNEAVACGNDAGTKDAFLWVTRARQDIVRFGDTRVVLTEDPEEMLEKLYGHFVQRDFADKAYHDKLLQRQVREALRRANLTGYFRSGEIGNEWLHVTMPFVHVRDHRPVMAIKPLDLNRPEANQVFDLGGHWVERVRRLQKHDLLPASVMFAIQRPAGGHPATSAVDEIVGDLRSLGTTVVAVEAQDQIIQFARAAALH